MSEKFTPEQIRNYWKEQAMEHGQSPSASWSDHIVIEMEIREILKYLEDGDRVLDVGCANGYSTVQFALQKSIHIRGCDYIPEMVRQARLRTKGLESKLAGDVEFKVGDILNLQEPEGSYDKVVVTRVLINLAEWKKQLRGLSECIRVLKTGGLLLCSEATLDGWKKLNKFRQEWGLPEIPIPDFNNYLDQQKVVEAVSSDLQLVELKDFASTYFVGTRVIKPLLANASGATVDVADPDMEWNHWFSQLPSLGDYGTQKLFVFRKL